MTAEEAVARVVKLLLRRVEKAQAYADAAAEYEQRALSADEVLSGVQREFLVSLGVQAQRSAKAMQDDAEALDVVLGLAGVAPDAKS